jgi:hypothetical protein
MPVEKCRITDSVRFLQPIFQDNNGLAVKFFIQKDLAQEIQAELCETVTVSLPLFLFLSF